ncbi:hypothetical protein, partial [Acinetobacter baumannii]|uniref:hypothetical protein n=1 Tax=Acinetobacter baumannii TaxID=470 RepID=UPI000A48CCA8
ALDAQAPYGITQYKRSPALRSRETFFVGGQCDPAGKLNNAQKSSDYLYDSKYNEQTSTGSGFLSYSVEKREKREKEETHHILCRSFSYRRECCVMDIYVAG